MVWTIRAILGLVGIFIAWCLGWFLIALILMAMKYWNYIPPETPLTKFAGIAPMITYLLGGPAACFLYVRWIRKKAGKEHEDQTRQRIAQLKRDKNRADTQ